MSAGPYRVIDRRQRSRRVAALGVAALAVLSLLGFLIWSGYQEAIHVAETTTRNYAAIMEARLDATLRRAEADLQDLVRTVPVAALSQRAAPQYARELNSRLVARLINFPELAGLRIFDADGARLYTSDDENASRTNIADRDYFRLLRDNPAARLVFSEVLVSRTTGRARMPVAKAIRDSQGAFRGIASATIELDHFQALFQSLDIGDHGNISWRRSDDHRLVLRWPSVADAVNKPLNSRNKTVARLAAGERAMTVHVSAETDGVARIISIQMLEHYPFYVGVGVARDEVLAAWQARSLAVGLSGLLLVGLLAGLLYRLVRAENSLMAREELMRSTFEQAAVGIAHVAPNSGRILIANERFCSVLGYSQKELIGMDTHMITPAGELPKRAAIRAELIGGAISSSSRERSFVKKDGSLLWANRSLSLVRDAHGQPRYFIVMIEDISVRKQADEARARLAAVADSSSDAIFIRDVEGRIVYWNDSASQLYGYTSAEIVGKDSDFLLPQDLLEERGRNRARLRQGLAVPTFETVRIHKDGTRLDVSISVSPVKDYAGDFIGIATIARDISERVHKAALMRLLESLARATNEATTPETAMLDCLKRICAYGDWQIGHVALFAPGESMGIAATSLWFCENEARFDEFMRLSDEFSYNGSRGKFAGVALRERRPVWIDDLSVAHDFGRLRFAQKFDIRAGFIFPIIVRGEPSGFLEFFSTNVRAPDELLLDAINSVASQLARLIERSRAEAELARLNVGLELRVANRTAELEAVNRELSEFSYTIAHDLRAPVRAINGFSSLVLKASEDKLEQTSVAHLRRVVAGSERMGELIDDLLSLARLSRQDLRRQDFNLSEAAAGVVAALSEAQPESRVRITIQPDIKANGDPGLMRVVLDNLIGNAWKFSAKTDAASIDIRTERQAGRTTYVIRDNGAGFDMQYANKLFAPFQRLHQADEFEGTGIGLATVRKIIRRHDGEIWLDSAVNVGTTVSFTLG